MKAKDVFEGSDAELTTNYYARLSALGPIGLVAVNLFRASKASVRAKLYRGGIRGKGSYKRMAYDRKAWSIDKLCEILSQYGAELNIGFGWKQDPGTRFHEAASWVLYVDIPNGPSADQVSFHSPTRGKGPDYTGVWDEKNLSSQRIIEFCDRVYTLGLVAS